MRLRPPLTPPTPSWTKTQTLSTNTDVLLWRVLFLPVSALPVMLGEYRSYVLLYHICAYVCFLQRCSLSKSAVPCVRTHHVVPRRAIEAPCCRQSFLVPSFLFCQSRLAHRACPSVVVLAPSISHNHELILSSCDCVAQIRSKWCPVHTDRSETNVHTVVVPDGRLYDRGRPVYSS